MKTKIKKNFFLFFVLIIFLCLITSSNKNNVKQSINISINEKNIINNIPDTMFGFNYWLWVSTWGGMVKNTEELIKPLNIKLLRFGGINNDVDWPDPVDENAINEFLTYCQAIGAEPFIQVPVARYNDNEKRVERAFQMIETVMSKTKLKYVSIGNEPDIYTQVLVVNSNYNVSHLKGYWIDQYIQDFNTIAKKIKERYSDIKIIGLELSNRKEWIPKFIRNCKDQLDYLSVHFYPYDASQLTYINVRSGFQKIEEFYSEIIKTIKENADGKSIPLIIGETNVSWEGDPKLSNNDASMGTFSAGLWFADMIGISTAQKEIYSIMPWSIREGWNNGFINADNNPKPVYYIYKMFSSMSLSQQILFKKVNENQRVYGYKDKNKNIIIYIVNWDKKKTQLFHFEFSDLFKDYRFDYECNPLSLTCLKINSNGTKTAYVYSEKEKTKEIKELIF